MQILQFCAGRARQLVDVDTTCGNDRIFWLDVERSESDWHDRAQPWLGMRLHDGHGQDTLNDTHLPYFHGTKDYDLLIVRALCPDCPAQAPATRPVAFIVTGTAVVSVRPPGDPCLRSSSNGFWPPSASPPRRPRCFSTFCWTRWPTA